MTRIATSYYGAAATTQFQWATSDNDLFDRELDLYRLAQALENHDHSSGKGLPVTRLGDYSITQNMYALLSIPTGAYQLASIDSAQIKDGAITDAKMLNQKMNVIGGTFTENVRIQRALAAGQGYLFVGNGNNYFAGIDTAMYINNASGGPIYLVGDPWSYRPGAPTTGFMFFGSGASIGYNGSLMISNGYRIHTEEFDASSPLGGVVWFRTQAELTAAGVKWTKEVNSDGRLLVGVGTAVGSTFVQNTFYGTNWQPGTLFTPTAGTLAVSGLTIGATTNPAYSFLAAAGGGGGSTNVSTANHEGHTVTGGALSGAPGITGLSSIYFPPMLAVVWGRRVS